MAREASANNCAHQARAASISDLGVPSVRQWLRQSDVQIGCCCTCGLSWNWVAGLPVSVGFGIADELFFSLLPTLCRARTRIPEPCESTRSRMADDPAGEFPVDAVGSLLAAAGSPADVEAAVVSSLGLEPRECIRDRAIVDLTVGCIAAVRAAGGTSAQCAAGAGVCFDVFRRADRDGWSAKSSAIAFAQERLLDAAMPPDEEGQASVEAAAPEPPLTPELSDAVSRYLGVTLLSQWELHRVAVGGAGGALRRDELDESRVVDAPRRPPPLGDATPA